MDEPDAIRDDGKRDAEATESTVRRRPSASLQSGRAHLAETTSCYLRGTHALHDLQEAVIDFATIGRATGIPPEELLVSMKEICEPVWGSPHDSPDETQRIRDRLVKQLIDTYFRNQPTSRSSERRSDQSPPVG
jgi:hypothetical protein